MNRGVAVVGVALTFAACSTSSSSADNMADAATPDANVEAGADAGITDCVIPAGIEPGPSYGAYPYDALPSGSCNTTTACGISIDPCCVPTDSDAVDEYTCTCVSGAWQCVDTVQGGGACHSAIASDCPEAGLDSGTD